jgi:N-acetylglucosaminyldiphosphoundecaprenol N-acetyl-beta-D-mannosaminyltransferase
MTVEKFPPTKLTIGSPVTALPFDAQIDVMMDWARARLSKVVCIANVHMLVEAHHKPAFGAILKQADLVTPDGMPLVWMLKLLGAANQNRVAGFDVMMALCDRATQQQVGVFFLGSEAAILDNMRERLDREFPHLPIAGMEPLPFRPMTPAEDEAIVRQIVDSGAGLVFLSLGCPKQEIWMAEHRDRIPAVMLGLGGMFPVYAGVHKLAPPLMRKLGLEWLYRLSQEPRRLFWRYASTNPVFVWLAIEQLVTNWWQQNFARQQLNGTKGGRN